MQFVGSINFDAGTSYTLSGGTLNFAASGGRSLVLPPLAAPRSLRIAGINPH